MRSTNSIKNIVVNLGSQLLGILMSFFCRVVFIRMLGDTYLGVNGVFSNILSIFSLAELGIGSAIIFSMYKPLAENDQPKIGALMALYRRAYHTIGLVVAIAGLAFAPFYRLVLKDPPQIPYLTAIYLLYVFNSVVTYFLSYKQSIITADQKNYICTLYQYGFCIAQNILQIFILIFTKNFILYLCTQILFSFFTNYFLARKADRMYPYLRRYRNRRLERRDRAAIVKNIKAMFMHRVGNALLNGTDSIILSAFVSTASAGIYSNYLLITVPLQGLTSQVFSSISASVGNLGAVEGRSKSYQVYRAVNFAGFWIFSFCSISLLCLFNPFLVLWAGPKLLFPLPIVFMISLNFYLMGMRQPTLMFKDALGLFWYDRYKSPLAALVNLVFSIVLVQQAGTIGVFIGTTIALVAVCVWVEAYVLYRNGFHRNVGAFFLHYALYAALTAAAGLLTWYLCSFVPGNTVFSLMLKILICVLVPNLIYLLLFHRTEEYLYLKNMVLSTLRGRKKR